MVFNTCAVRENADNKLYGNLGILNEKKMENPDILATISKLKDGRPPLVIGFAVSYFLAFHVRSNSMQVVLFVLCTIPFWTSNVIRMIAWVPLLGRHGLVNSALVGLGAVDQPVEWLLFSEFSVVLALVHLFTFFMVVPIFNSMMRIDRSLLEALKGPLTHLVRNALDHGIDLFGPGRDDDAFRPDQEAPGFPRPAIST